MLLSPKSIFRAHSVHVVYFHDLCCDSPRRSIRPLCPMFSPVSMFINFSVLEHHIFIDVVLLFLMFSKASHAVAACLWLWAPPCQKKQKTLTCWYVFKSSFFL